MLTTPDHSLFSDEIVARIRGMVDDLAMQVLWAQAEATGQSGREEFADRHRVALAAEFQANSRLLAHCHSLAMEWQLTERLEAQTGLDPVLSPMIQLLIASERDEVASNAMAVLAAQARFAQAQRRMELPLRELPAELVHEVLLAWRHYNGERRSDAMVRAETKMRNGFDERLGRLSQLARLITAIGDDAREALMIEDFGQRCFSAHWRFVLARHGNWQFYRATHSKRRALCWVCVRGDWKRRGWTRCCCSFIRALHRISPLPT